MDWEWLQRLRTYGGPIVVGQERTKDGKLHWQGYVHFLRKQRPMERFHMKTTAGVPPHWTMAKDDKTIETQIMQNRIYCTKELSCIHDDFKKADEAPIKDPLQGKQYNALQTKLAQILESEADDRTIHWVHDEKGCAGKTTFAKHWVINNPTTAVYVSGSAADIKYALAEMTHRPTVVFYNVARTATVDYVALEEIKDGIFFSGKYKSSTYYSDNTHVIVLANEAPYKKALTPDRWNIIVPE